MPLRVAGMIGDPTQLDVLLSLPGDVTLERSLHATFGDRRIEGEWFYLGSAEKAVERVEGVLNARTAGSTLTITTRVAEPLTQLAQDAARHHEVFRAWVDAGFSEDQALRLIAHNLRLAEWWI